MHVSAELTDVIVGVLGLDNRQIAGRNGAGDPPVTNPTSVPEMMQHYNFPTHSAGGQTIGIFASFPVRGSAVIGYVQSDINQYYAAPSLSGFTAPTPVPVQNIDGTQNNPAMPDGEATMDICIASTVAQGATIAVYFNAGDENGWHGVLQKVAFPQAGDPTPSVLSSSFFLCKGDDPVGRGGIPTSTLNALSMAFQDAAGQGVTVCVASGDFGAESNIFDFSGQQHVDYPASDPWVLSCGGTTVGRDDSDNPVEYVWNDVQTATLNDGTVNDFPGATGGGVSAYFPQPTYQFGAGVPQSLVDHHVGRGVPDVAGNASWDSGYYPMYTIGNDPNPWNGNGTSAVAPLYAGLFTVINAALRTRVGFVNPVLYALGNTVCKDVNPAVVGGPTDNGFNGVTGYPADAGWDACTGWGTINGNALLTALQQILTPLWVAFVANHDSNDLLTCPFAKNTGWSVNAPVQGNGQRQFTKMAPSLAVFDDQLWVAFVANHDSNDLLTCSFAKNTGWSVNAPVQGNGQRQFTKMAPSLAVFDDQLWVAFVANHDSNDLLTCSFAKNTGWSVNAPVQGNGQRQFTKMAPSLADFPG